MGLLDDAIREHLDLKRRRGADPTEIERAEREALGPVRRAPEPLGSTEEPLPEPLAYDHEGDQEWHEPADEHIPMGVVEPDQAPADLDLAPPPLEPFGGPADASARGPETREPEFESHPQEPEPLTLEEQPRKRGFLGRRKQPKAPEPEDHYLAEDHDDPFAEDNGEIPTRPSRGASTSPQHLADEPGGETVEYEVEAAFEEERRREKEDVLEETPEFLQDTPDHDRLWFEQRPPRDFDFDG